MKIKKIYFICRGYVYLDRSVLDSGHLSISKGPLASVLVPNTWIEVTREPELIITKIYMDGYRNVRIPLSADKLVDLFLNFQIKKAEVCPKGGRHVYESYMGGWGNSFERCTKCLI